MTEPCYNTNRKRDSGGLWTISLEKTTSSDKSSEKLAEFSLDTNTGILSDVKFYPGYDAEKVRAALRSKKSVLTGRKKEETFFLVALQGNDSRKYCRFQGFLDVNDKIGEKIREIVEKDTTEQMDFIFPYGHSGHMGFIYAKAKSDKTTGKKIIEKATIRDPSGYFASCLELYNKVKFKSESESIDFDKVTDVPGITNLSDRLKNMEIKNLAELKKIGNRLKEDAATLGITDINLLIEDLKKGNLQGNKGVCTFHSRAAMCILNEHIATSDKQLTYDEVVEHLDSPEFEILKAKRVTQEISRNTYELTEADITDSQTDSQKKEIVTEKIAYKKFDDNIEIIERPITLENMFNMELLRESYKKVQETLNIDKTKIEELESEIESIEQQKKQIESERDELRNKKSSLPLLNSAVTKQLAVQSKSKPSRSVSVSKAPRQLAAAKSKFVVRSKAPQLLVQSRLKQTHQPAKPMQPKEDQRFVNNTGQYGLIITNSNELKRDKKIQKKILEIQELERKLESLKISLTTTKKQIQKKGELVKASSPGIPQKVQTITITNTLTKEEYDKLVSMSNILANLQQQSKSTSQPLAKKQTGILAGLAGCKVAETKSSSTPKIRNIPNRKTPDNHTLSF